MARCLFAACLAMPPCTLPRKSRPESARIDRLQEDSENIQTRQHCPNLPKPKPSSARYVICDSVMFAMPLFICERAESRQKRSDAMKPGRGSTRGVQARGVKEAAREVRKCWRERQRAGAQQSQQRQQCMKPMRKVPNQSASSAQCGYDGIVERSRLAHAGGVGDANYARHFDYFSANHAGRRLFATSAQPSTASMPRVAAQNRRCAQRGDALTPRRRTDYAERRRAMSISHAESGAYVRCAQHVTAHKRR